MRFLTKPLLALALALLVAGVFVYYFSGISNSNQFIATITPIEPVMGGEKDNEGEEDKYQNAKERAEYEIEITKDLDLGEVPKERLLAASRVTNQLLNSAKRSTGDEMDWEERGPNNVGGRTRAILIDAADPTNNTVIAGGVSGGIWRTTNFMSTNPKWIKIDDFFENLAVSSIVQDPTNPKIIYFGTGEGWTADFRGLGIWKSVDGGRKFNRLVSTSNRAFRYVQDLAIDHSGALYASCIFGGVQRSTDGGDSWTQTLGTSVGQGSSNYAADLEVATNGDLYVTLGLFENPGTIWKSSINKGSFQGQTGHWKNVTPPQGDYGRIELAVAPSNSKVLYAVCQGANSNDAEYIFHSIDGGDNWISRPVPTIYDQGSFPPFTRFQAWYDLIAAVHPEDENELFIGGIDVLRSKDAGSSWQQVSDWTANNPGFQAPGLTANQYVHADIHEIIFVPNTWGKEIVIGSDGGISHGTDLQYEDRLPIFKSKNTDYNVTQFYSVAVHPTQGSNYFLAGSQDNGTQQFNQPGINSTVEATGGDGGFCHIDQNNPLIQMTSFTNNFFSVSQNGGKSFNSFYFDFNGGSFINPTDYDNDSGHFYAGFSDGRLLRWFDLGKGDENGQFLLQADLVSGFSGIVSAVTTAPNTDNRVWIGIRSRNTGSTIALIDDADKQTLVTMLTPPVSLRAGSNISSIEVDPKDPSHLLVTVSNYGSVSVYEVVDADTNSPKWINVEGSLPDMPVRWALFDDEDSDKAIIATELGVWKTHDLNGIDTKWIPTNKGLAHVRVDMLQRRASDGLVAAATHGRGLFTAGGKKATCNDGIKNGDEKGVDCGGSNCAACNDYCESGSSASHGLAIGRVAIGAFENKSGAEFGYSDFTDQIVSLNPGESIFFELDPIGPFGGSSVRFTLWIDYNKDKDFDDPGEQVFSSNTRMTGTLYQTFSIPEGLQGETRMRITMNLFGQPGPCDGYRFGETEDYTVHFNNCGAPENITCTGLFGNKMLFTWDEVIDANSYELQYRIGTSLVWKSVKIASTNYTLPVNNTSRVTYRLRSICDLGEGPWSASHSFSFGGRTTYPEQGELDLNLNSLTKIYPNPIINDFNIEYMATENGNYEIFDASGKSIANGILSKTFGEKMTQTINTGNWTAGTYLVRARIGQEVFTKQVVKQ